MAESHQITIASNGPHSSASLVSTRSVVSQFSKSLKLQRIGGAVDLELLGMQIHSNTRSASHWMRHALRSCDNEHSTFLSDAALPL